MFEVDIVFPQRIVRVDDQMLSHVLKIAWRQFAVAVLRRYNFHVCDMLLPDGVDRQIFSKLANPFRLRSRTEQDLPEINVPHKLSKLETQLWIADAGLSEYMLLAQLLQFRKSFQRLQL